MWGTPPGRDAGRWPYRFIPTHVGNSGEQGGHGNTVSVHPHACGELLTGSASARACYGSSPRMWGTRFSHGSLHCPGRFIPTHVGNSAAGRPTAGSRSVHPHACGELGADLLTVQLGDGSSPRMWGTPQFCHFLFTGCRFIPTHVGNSFTDTSANYPVSVHPHACGELLTKGNVQATHAGSSPRMWGTLFNFYIKTRKITSGDLHNF